MGRKKKSKNTYEIEWEATISGTTEIEAYSEDEARDLFYSSGDVDFSDHGGPENERILNITLVDGEEPNSD